MFLSELAPEQIGYGMMVRSMDEGIRGMVVGMPSDDEVLVVWDGGCRQMLEPVESLQLAGRR